MNELVPSTTFDLCSFNNFCQVGFIQNGQSRTDNIAIPEQLTPQEPLFSQLQANIYEQFNNLKISSSLVLEQIPKINSSLSNGSTLVKRLDRIFEKNLEIAEAGCSDFILINSYTTFTACYICYIFVVMLLFLRRINYKFASSQFRNDIYRGTILMLNFFFYLFVVGMYMVGVVGAAGSCEWLKGMTESPSYVQNSKFFQFEEDRKIFNICFHENGDASRSIQMQESLQIVKNFEGVLNFQEMQETILSYLKLGKKQLQQNQRYLAQLAGFYIIDDKEPEDDDPYFHQNIKSKLREEIPLCSSNIQLVENQEECFTEFQYYDSERMKETPINDELLCIGISSLNRQYEWIAKKYGECQSFSDLKAAQVSQALTWESTLEQENLIISIYEDYQISIMLALDQLEDISFYLSNELQYYTSQQVGLTSTMNCSYARGYLQLFKDQICEKVFPSYYVLHVLTWSLIVLFLFLMCVRLIFS